MFFLLSCRNDFDILDGFVIVECRAVGVMPPKSLGTIHSCDSRQGHILKEAVKAVLPSVFREYLTNFLVKPKRIRHDLMVEAQYPPALTSIAKK